MYSWNISGRKLARNVTAMVTTGEAPTEVESPDVQELIKPITEAVYISTSFLFFIFIPYIITNSLIYI